MAISTRKRDQLQELMKDIDIAMFTTYGERGFPVSRPLSTQQADFDGEVLWFFVRRNTPKVAEIGRNPKVNVAYASNERNVYMSVAGVADIVDDQAMIDLLWNDGLKAYFRRGQNDPNLALIRVRVHTVEYWQGPSTGVGKMIAFITAAVTGRDSALGANRLMRMKGKAPRKGAAAKAKTKPRAAVKKASARGTAKKAPMRGRTRAAARRTKR